MWIKRQLPRNLIAVPLAPADALSLAHDEILPLKKINSTFISVMKTYTDFFNPTLKLFRYDFFVHPHSSANNVMPILH